MNEELLINKMADKVRAGKLGKLIQGKISEAEFMEIVSTAVRRELAILREKVNSTEGEKNHVRTF